MGGCEERINQLYHYNTTFGTVWFNVIAIHINVLQLIATAAILGFRHNEVTIEHVWWPAFECLRIFVLTLCRGDVLLKEPRDIERGIHGTQQTRKIIMICNLLGAFSLIVGAPIYLLLLPDNGDQLMYYTYLIGFLIMIILRIGLSIPMFAALINGTPMYRVIDGNNYERIGDHPNQRGNTTDPESAEPGARRRSSERRRLPIPEDVLIALQEEQQLERALQESRRDSLKESRTLREAQDLEYQEALREQQVLDQSKGNILPNITNDNELPNIMDDLTTHQRSVSSSTSSLSSIGINDDENNIDTQLNTEEILKQEKEEAIQALIDDLPSLDDEPPKSGDTVSVRVRLQNGTRCTRRFDHTTNIGKIKIWVNHELVKNDSAELINDFQLVSTMPRTVYNQSDVSLEDLKFWRKNTQRECQTPVLYVEEITQGQLNDSSDESSIE